MYRSRPLATAFLALVATGTMAAGTGSVYAGRQGAIKAPLPKVSKTPFATKVRKGDKRIERYRQHYLKRQQQNHQPSAAKNAKEARLVRAARKLNSLIRKNPDKRPVLIILEGPDGAGKSGTIRRLEGAFKGVGTVRQVHFGAPKKGETGHWLSSYRAQLPKKGEVVIWDRSYMGRVVYDPYYKMAGKKEIKQRYRDIEKFEAEMSKSVRIVKFYLDARGDRIAQTIGKREAQAPEKLDDGDYKSFKDRKVIRKLFDGALRNTGGSLPWHRLPMVDRAQGRQKMMKVLKKELGGAPSAGFLPLGLPLATAHGFPLQLA